MLLFPLVAGLTLLHQPAEDWDSSPDLGNWLLLQSFVFEGPGNAFQFSRPESLLSGLVLFVEGSIVRSNTLRIH